MLLRFLFYTEIWHTVYIALRSLAYRLQSYDEIVDVKEIFFFFLADFQGPSIIQCEKKKDDVVPSLNPACAHTDMQKK